MIYKKTQSTKSMRASPTIIIALLNSAPYSSERRREHVRDFSIVQKSGKKKRCYILSTPYTLRGKKVLSPIFSFDLLEMLH